MSDEQMEEQLELRGWRRSSRRGTHGWVEVWNRQPDGLEAALKVAYSIEFDTQE